MADPTFAALDPIFWSFHAYIDLIWDRWQKVHNIDPTCLDCPLQGLPAEKTAKDLINVETQLGYFYTENAGLAERLAMAPAAAPWRQVAARPRLSSSGGRRSGSAAPLAPGARATSRVSAHSVHA